MSLSFFLLSWLSAPKKLCVFFLHLELQGEPSSQRICSFPDLTQHVKLTLCWSHSDPELQVQELLPVICPLHKSLCVRNYQEIQTWTPWLLIFADPLGNCPSMLQVRLALPACLLDPKSLSPTFLGSASSQAELDLHDGWMPAKNIHRMACFWCE